MSTVDAGASPLSAMAKTLIEVEVEVQLEPSTEIAAITGTGGAPVEEVRTASFRLDGRSH